MAVALAEAGADIVGLSRSPDCHATCEAVRSLGRRFISIEQDLGEATPTQLQASIDSVVGDLGRLDILVNNAGVIRRNPAIEYTEADWDTVIAVNQKALFFLSQAAARAMISGSGGKIINIASMLSYQGGILVPAYTASKSAVVGLTRALANEWAARHINVNAIAPGYVTTDNTAPLRADESRNAAIVARIPAGRWGTPEDLKGAVIFLASSASNYMHGETINVDGGWMAR